MILFIHGFASCGLGEKSKLLIDHFGRDQVLTPDLPLPPAEAAAFLERIKADQPIDLLVGSSLGGYYATWLNRQKPTPTVLINPAVRPWRLLCQHLGPQRRWCDGAEFDLTHQHIDQLKSLFRTPNSPDERYLVLLQTGDEVLDYRDAAELYADQQLIVDNGGNHRFENLAAHLSAIAQYRTRRQINP